MECFFSGLQDITLIIAFVTSLLLIIAYIVLRDKDVPPGPTGIPILGYWPLINSEFCHLHFMKLKRKYGNIFSFRVTGQLYISLASFKVLKEAHITNADCFTERTQEFNIMGKVFEDGVVYSNGEKWQSLRKFFLQEFRERGMSIFKENTAEALCETITALVEELRRNSSKPVNVLALLEKKTKRIIWNTLFGSDSSVSENDIEQITSAYKFVLTQIHSSNLILCGRIAKYLITPFLPNYKKAMKCHRNVKNMFLRIIMDHQNTFDEDHIRDIIDSYIHERNIRRSKGDPTTEHFTDESLAANLLQFVGDGVSNSALFIISILKPLLDHPEEQEKIYKELVEVCGEDRNPGLQDRNKLTYTNAFLLEAHRCNNFVPLFPSLLCTKETTLGGYRIPKGSVTVTNGFSIHNDPQVYENPEKFDPSRFLVKDAKSKPEIPITFGVGKRVCLGEGFILMLVFLFCTAIVKNFQIRYSQPKSYYELFENRTLEVHVTPRNTE